MKKIFRLVSLLLAIVITFSSCSLSVNPETIERIVSNISDSAGDAVTPLSEEYNGRKNYYYSSLSGDEKVEYTKIYEAYMGKKNFTVNVEENRLDRMFNFVLYDNPEIFWVDASYSFSKSPTGIFVEPVYRFTDEEIKKMKLEMNSEVNRIVSLAGTGASDFGREKFFHDYICKNTVYDMATYEEYGDSAYSVLIDGKAICEGYARALKILLDACGIYNYLVVGNTENDEGKTEGHMWNVVSVDGELYHVDITWDDCDGDLGEVIYLYFNLTDEDIRKDHFDIEPYDNNCVSLKFNYFAVNGLYFSTFNNFKGMVSPCADALTDGVTVEMRFANKADYEAIKNKADNNETDRAFYDFTVDVVRASGQKTGRTSYFYNDDFNYLCIVFEKG